MIYEMRTYRCLPGRLPLLLKRFEDHTIALWGKHDINPIGFWINEIGTSNHELIYMIAWPSLAERERIWPAFISDPAWAKIRDESEASGPIVENVTNSLLNPTSFSKLQ